MTLDDNEGVLRQIISADIEEVLSNHELALSDSEDEDHFIRKYGDIEYQYIKRPRDAVWFIRPHALNYFMDGVLYRTKGERSSAKTELFLDLLYVGIIANLAGAASETATFEGLLKYILLFLPAWVVWADIKDFTNYYYNEDLLQRLYIFWIITVLAFYANNAHNAWEGVHGGALAYVPYMICRLLLAISLLVYSIYIPQHRAQLRVYAVTIFITSALWIPIIFFNPLGKKIASAVLLLLEQVCFSVCYSPWFKKKLNLRTSTALNIEHEVERFSAFVTIAIGEFLYKVVASNPFGVGFNIKFLRGVFLLLIAYCFAWLYNHGSTSKRAVHPLRHLAARAIAWIYFHVPLIAALVLAADAGGDFCKLDETDIWAVLVEEEHERSLHKLAIFFSGGLGVAMLSLFVLGYLDVPRDPASLHIIPRTQRIALRLPVAVIYMGLPFAHISSTLLMGLCALLLTVVVIFESVVSTPKDCLWKPSIQLAEDNEGQI